MSATLAHRRALLEQVSGTYRRGSVQDDWMRRLCVRAIAPWLQPGHRLLEVGCSDGLMTALLAERVAHVVTVEATERFTAELATRQLARVELRHGMIEDHRPDAPLDAIVATWVLTHLADPAAELRRWRDWLAPHGHLFVAVPNVRVLSRQLALHMGLIDDLYALSDNDRAHGHLRAYDSPRLQRELEATGYAVVHRCGLMLKPLADFQMDRLYADGLLGPEHVEGLYRLGLDYPELCSATLCVCRRRDDD